MQKASQEQVWQRVQAASSSPEGQWLQDMAEEKLREAASLRLLGNQTNDASLLLQAQRRAERHARLLMGIHLLVTGKKARTVQSQATREPAEVVLRRLYGKALGQLSGYERGVKDPQLGAVYTCMLEETRDHCRDILLLLGQIR